MGTTPCTKETTLHYYRDPLAEVLRRDSDVDFLGLVMSGTSDNYEDKIFIGERTAAVLDAMRPDGFLISLGAFGNPHIDFAAVVEASGRLGIPAVGLSFTGSIAEFIVHTPYLLAHIDLNKSAEGAETCVIGESTIVELDAVKALAILKNRIRRKKARQDTGDFLPKAQLDFVKTQPEVTRLGRTLHIREFFIADLCDDLEGSSNASLQRADPRDADADIGNGQALAHILRLNVRGLERKVLDCRDAGRATGWLGQRMHWLRLVKDVRVRVVRALAHDVQVNSILDFAPVATKVEGKLGQGITHLCQNVQLMLTAVDTAGFQPINFGAACGKLSEAVCFGRSGTPALGDHIIHVDVLLQEGEAVTRDGIAAAHLAADLVLEEVRTCLREQDRYAARICRTLVEEVRPELLKIAVVKMVAGDGAMNDTALFAKEPGGFMGSYSVMDVIHNLPVIVSPNEYADGIARSLS